MTILWEYLVLALVVLVYVTIVYLVSLSARRSDVADVAWGLGFLVIAVASWALAPNVTTLKVLVTIVACLWGLRLPVHILVRNRNKAEDFRYRQWKQQWGNAFYIRSYLQVFGLQGFMMLLISAPMSAVLLLDPGYALTGVGMVGLGLWLLGFVFETVSDWQLLSFVRQKENKGKIMTNGLWKYSRHPNYFGEIVLWWGVWLLAVDANVWIAAAGPAALMLMLRFVSGVPLLEARYQDNKSYLTYAQKTNMLVPWWPRL